MKPVEKDGRRKANEAERRESDRQTWRGVGGGGAGGGSSTVFVEKKTIQTSTVISN